MHLLSYTRSNLFRGGSEMATEIWAHRGSSRKYVENTISAFQQAIDDGSDGIELDVQRTKDGQLVVFHDENLKRLTGVNQFVWELNWSEVKQLKLHALNEDDLHIPLLEEVLSLVKPTSLTLNIELKNSLFFYPGLEAEVLKMVNNFEMLPQVIFSSFNHASVQLMSQLAGPEYCALLTSDIQVEPWAYAKKVGVRSLHPMVNSFQQVNYVKECHEHGLKVNVWTADKEAHIYAGLLLGVDAIMTNEPEKAVQLREQFLTDKGQKAREIVQAYGQFNLK